MSGTASWRSWEGAVGPSPAGVRIKEGDSETGKDGCGRALTLGKETAVLAPR